MSTIVVLVAGGLLTFAMRFSFIYLIGRAALPEYARRVLRYVPAAVLAAIIVPDVLMHSGRLDLSPGNSYLLAGAAAVIAALWIRNMLMTILIGMAVLVLVQLL